MEVSMNIQSVTNEIISSAEVILEAINTFVSWAGHKIRLLTSSYVMPAFQKLWACTLNVANTVKDIIKAGPKTPFGCATAFFLTGIVAFKLADRKAYEDAALAKTALKALGIAAFISATLSTSIGIAALVAV